MIDLPCYEIPYISSRHYLVQQKKEGVLVGKNFKFASISLGRKVALGFAVILAVGGIGVGLHSLQSSDAPKDSVVDQKTPPEEGTTLPESHDLAAAENEALLQKAFLERYPTGCGVYLADLTHDGLNDLVVMKEDMISLPELHVLTVRNGAVEQIWTEQSPYIDTVNNSANMVFLLDKEPETDYAWLVQFYGPYADGYGEAAFRPFWVDADGNKQSGTPFGYVKPEDAEPMEYAVTEEVSQQLQADLPKLLAGMYTLWYAPNYVDQSVLGDTLPCDTVNTSYLTVFDGVSVEETLLDGRVHIQLPAEWVGQYNIKTGVSQDSNILTAQICVGLPGSNPDDWAMLFEVMGYLDASMTKIQEMDIPGVWELLPASWGCVALYTPTDLCYDYTNPEIAKQYEGMKESLPAVFRTAVVR